MDKMVINCGEVGNWALSCGDLEGLRERFIAEGTCVGKDCVDEMHSLLGQEISAELFPTTTHPNFHKDISVFVTAVISSRPNKSGEMFCKIYGEIV